MSRRIRSLKPELLEDEPIAALTDSAWRLLISLTIMSDDYGNVRAGERYLAANVWQDTTRQVAEPLEELVLARHVEPYVKGDQRYLHLRGFTKHQRIDNAGKPQVPGPADDDGSDVEWFRDVRPFFGEVRRESGKFAAKSESSPLARAPARARARIPAAGREGKGREGKGSQRRGEPETPAPPPASPDMKSKRGTRMTSDWTPSPEVVAWGRSEGVDVLAHLEEFRDYWIAVPGSKGTKLDWDATLRNRMRQLIEDGRAIAVAEVLDGAEPGTSGVLPLAPPAPPEVAARAIETIKANLAKAEESMRPRFLRDEAGGSE